MEERSEGVCKARKGKEMMKGCKNTEEKDMNGQREEIKGNAEQEREVRTGGRRRQWEIKVRRKKKRRGGQERRKLESERRGGKTKKKWNEEKEKIGNREGRRKRRLKRWGEDGRG